MTDSSNFKGAATAIEAKKGFLRPGSGVVIEKVSFCGLGRKGFIENPANCSEFPTIRPVFGPPNDRRNLVTINWKHNRILAILVLSLTLARAWAGEGLWNVGILNRGNWDFEPGTGFQQGVELGYSNLHLASHRLEIKAAFLTSRPENLFRESTPKRDFFLLSPVWHFRRRSFFDPLARADFGYAHYDKGGWIGSVQVGLNINIARAQWGLYGHSGYAYLEPEASRDFTGVFAMGIWTML